ncbi:MAG: [Fe-Fe] hydrogenase large subunit C-terminal domain-containing protein [bacterium]|nr:[Fe-Fe] hydrogenase large subunit C-terminal domain-containing protein [bacterium]
MNTKRFHSVRLDKEKCKACTNCLRRCPTEAIRVRGGRAHIIDERCIDCGECIRVCEYHAKYAQTDPLACINRFKYKIALPAPALYGQFKHLVGASQVLEGLLKIGFDEVFEVAEGADIVTRAIRERMRNIDRSKYPIISSACPAIVRLIRVRFPDLIPHIIDVRQPMEVAAMVAKQEFCKRNDVPPEEVGCFFITPCAAKMTAIRNPIGHETSAVDGAISMMEIYGLLSSQMKTIPLDTNISRATAYGVGWANSGGEAAAVCPEHSMSVDGIENVIRVLEEIENDKLPDLVFFEGSACTGGCVGGPLTFENNYIARGAIRTLMHGCDITHPDEKVKVSTLNKYNLLSDKHITANSAMKLDDDIVEAMRKIEQMEEIVKRLPGFDCGSCGSPTCRTFAEDIVRGYATELDCIHILKDHLKVMAQQMVELAKTTRE